MTEHNPPTPPLTDPNDARAHDSPADDDQHVLTRNKRHLWGWYSYAFASEAFVIVSLTLFLPICLEQFARDNGVLLPGKTAPCSSVHASETGRASTDGAADAACVVKIGGVWVNSASFSLYVYSASVALQALTVISMGGIANHPPHRKRLLFFFAALGSLSALAFLLPFLSSASPFWPLVAPLAAAANVGFGASIVAMNAYLPGLARSDGEVLEVQRTVCREAREARRRRSSSDGANENDEHEGGADAPLLDGASSPHTAAALYTSTLSRTTARISSTGIALGYTAGIALLVLTLIPVRRMHGSTDSLRLAVGLSGAWWAALSCVAWAWLPNGEGDADADTAKHGDSWNLRREVCEAWKRLGHMLRWREIRRLKNTFWYLAAWFLLSDGFTTITSTAILFGKTTLHMSAAALTLVGILTPSAGILGSLLWPRMQRRLGWSNRTVLLVLVLMASAIPAYGCLGFAPVFRDIPGTHADANANATVVRPRFGGLTSQEEMFALAVYFGAVYGAFQGYARAFYAELIPPGDEARWYGLFSITDKSSSFLGPLIVGLIADSTGNIRYAFFFLVLMVWAAVPLLLAVDVDRGRVDAQRYADGRVLPVGGGVALTRSAGGEA